MSQVVDVLSSTQTLSHFTHDRHLLVLALNEYEFTCDGCNTPGAGERYHCKECLFDLHKECATSQANLSSHIHPIHPLVRTWERPDVAALFLGHRPCNVCEEQVIGLFFTCPVLSCNFFLHPICSNFPQYVPHSIDKQHPLTFQYAKDSACDICGQNCMGWCYRCEPCRIDIHLECFIPLPPPSPPNNYNDLESPSPESPGSSPSKSRRPVHHHHHPQDAGTGLGKQSSPSCGSQQQCPHKPKEDHDDDSRGGRKPRGRKRERMYSILGQIVSAVVATAITAHFVSSQG